MIYLDNSATTYPKPQKVISSVSNAMKLYGANPGRSGHKMSIQSAEQIYRCRRIAADFFNAEGPECVVFTHNCTCATNFVLKGLLKPGDHVVVSCMEHNAVMRPLKKLSETGIRFTVVSAHPQDNDATLDEFRKGINADTALIVCMHASNVCGLRFPVERIAAMARQYGIPILVDAAQSAGVLPIDLKYSKIDYLCVAGHKGLYGPMGTGMLITRDEQNLDTIIEGGTGTNSMFLEQPSNIPDKFESGTPNLPGIIGLGAGMEFVMKQGIERILSHEQKLIQRAYEGLSKIEGIKLYMPYPTERYFAPLLSFNVEGKDSETVGEYLNKNNIAVRSGLHCSPLAHEFLGTTDIGTVRVSPSVFTSMQNIESFISAIKKIV